MIQNFQMKRIRERAKNGMLTTCVDLWTNISIVQNSDKERNDKELEEDQTLSADVYFAQETL